MMFGRWIEPVLKKKMVAPFVHILFGARQTGKSTLLKKLIPEAAIWLDLSQPAQRSEYLIHPGQLVEQCRSLPQSRQPRFVVIDEVQTVPLLFDAVQHLYDSDKTRWRFVLCGSSARKLRVTGANLLPGRAFLHHTYPLILPERPLPEHGTLHYKVTSPLPMSPRKAIHPSVRPPLFPKTKLLERLTFGELPVVAVAPEKNRADLLQAYCLVYLEEELRREALIKDWAAFARFLRLAATESGQLLNYAKISKETGISQPAVKNYYQLLEDMFIAFRIPAFSKSKRKNLLSTDRFFFFDLGVRHAAAGLTLEHPTVSANPGPIFEQWVGIELWKRLQYLGTGKLHYLRTKSGMEIDFIIETHQQWTPIEVKWTEHPTLQDVRHLQTFLKENPRQISHAYLICRCPRPMLLEEKITALPWFCL